MKFTGKERDTESGNDYFGARYYSSAMGRFMSPDWSDDPDPVPYADYENPQSLNLYSYGSNNPLTNTDSDGHYSCDPDTWDPNTNTLTAGACHYDWSDWQQLFQLLNQATNTIANAASQAAQQVVNYATAPRDPGCMATMAGGGMAAGAFAGGALGGLGGGAGGTLVAPGVGTVGGAWAGAAAGATEGAGLGGAAGTAVGFVACRTGGGSGSGAGGAGTKETPQSHPEKFRPVRGTSAKVNTETGEVFVKDKSGHGGEHYEVYRNLRDYENGSRAYQVWADGSIGRSY